MQRRTSSTKDTIYEDQIKAVSGHGSHDILLLTIAFEVPNWLNARWIHVTSKMTAMKNGYPRPEKIKHFLKSRNQQIPIRISYKVPLFILYDCDSYHRIEFDVICSV